MAAGDNRIAEIFGKKLTLADRLSDAVTTLEMLTAEIIASDFADISKEDVLSGPANLDSVLRCIQPE